LSQNKLKHNFSFIPQLFSYGSSNTSIQEIKEDLTQEKTQKNIQEATKFVAKSSKMTE
jgi:hypothetical protein